MGGVQAEPREQSIRNDAEKCLSGVGEGSFPMFRFQVPGEQRSDSLLCSDPVICYNKSLCLTETNHLAYRLSLDNGL